MTHWWYLLVFLAGAVVVVVALVGFLARRKAVLPPDPAGSGVIEDQLPEPTGREGASVPERDVQGHAPTGQDAWRN